MNYYLRKRQDNMFILITTLYHEKNEDRQKEYLYCLDHNLADPEIESVVIFYESLIKKDPFLKKLKKRKRTTIVFWNRRPTFQDIFTYSNRRLLSKRIVLANADIYYDPKKGLNLLREIKLDHLILVLTRYNKLEHIDKFIEEHPRKIGVFAQSEAGTVMTQVNGKSIDSWIFQAPINPDFKCPFRLGIYNCDSFLNHELLKSFRYEVYNPCLDVISIHHHNGWHSNKYSTVIDEDGNTIPLDKWVKKNLDAGFYPADVPFCRLEHAIDRQ